MENITETNFVKLIMSLKHHGSTYVSFVSETLPDMKKRGNPFALPIMKRAYVHATVWFIYQNSVNAQREREQLEKDFVSAPRKWGVRLNPAFVLHNNRLYLSIKYNYDIEPSKYFDANGKELNAEEVIPWISESSSSSRQGTSKAIISKEYLIQHIKEIHILNGHYHITDISSSHTRESFQEISV